MQRSKLFGPKLVTFVLNPELLFFSSSQRLFVEQVKGLKHLTHLWLKDFPSYLIGFIQVLLLRAEFCKTLESSLGRSSWIMTTSFPR